jgi:hypothetical protein
MYIYLRLNNKFRFDDVIRFTFGDIIASSVENFHLLYNVSVTRLLDDRQLLMTTLMMDEEAMMSPRSSTTPPNVV